jgi:hypothetical protein
MTPEELQREIVYRIHERLALLGFTDANKESPKWAVSAAENEAHKWAKTNHPETFAKLPKK